MDIISLNISQTIFQILLIDCTLDWLYLVASIIWEDYAKMMSWILTIDILSNDMCKLTLSIVKLHCVYVHHSIYICLLLWLLAVVLFITNLLIMGFYDRFAISFSINRSINYKFAISVTKKDIRCIQFITSSKTRIEWQGYF